MVNESEFLESPVIQEVLQLKLPAHDYVIFGSGPMFALGIRPLSQLDDIDILARGVAFEKMLEMGKVEDAFYGGRVVRCGRVEVFEKWGPGGWDENEIISRGWLFAGLPFAHLDDLIEYKKRRGTAKDLEHLEMIRQYQRTH